MNINWSTSRCIICGSSDQITKEHLIPKCLAGKLVAKFLCRICNSTFGHREESEVLNDPNIRQIIDKRIVQELPELGARLRMGLEYIGHSEQGEVRGYMQDEEFIVNEQTLDDGSRIVPPDKTLHHVKNMAIKTGEGSLLCTEDDLKGLSSGESIEAASGIWITNWDVDSVKPVLSGPVINPVVPAKIAFEFLALRCGDDIYEDSPQLNSIRYQLRTVGELSEGDIDVERLEAQNNQLFHGLVFEGNKPGAQVQIRFFGSLAFRVCFRFLAIQCPRFGYTHDLISGDDCAWPVTSNHCLAVKLG